jgi:Uma2 family endonuclease
MHYALESRDMVKTERGLVMSTIVGAATPLAAGGRMTVDEFERFVEDTDERYELIDGHPIRKSDMDPPHVWTTEKLKRRLERMLPEGRFVRDDKPVKFSEDDQPDPDIAVVRGDEDTYKKRHPKPDDVALLIEVSWSRKRLRYDQDIKRPLYASRGIPVYWIVNALAQQVEVYTDPGPDGYATCEFVKRGEAVRVVIDGKDVGRIAVDEFLPEPDSADDADRA